MARVLSETLLSRERRSRSRSVSVRRVSGAGDGALDPSWGAGIRGYCRAISGNLNVSYKGHYQPFSRAGQMPGVSRGLSGRRRNEPPEEGPVG